MILALLLSSGLVSARSDEPKKIFLNTTNPSFYGDMEMNIELGDKIDIFCPLVDTFEETLNSENPLFLTLWAVDKDGYDNCSINGNTSKRIIRCTVPNYEKKFTIKATSFSALPGSLLFEEGETYYFIVPNYGRELEDIEEINSDGGLCRSHNIRFAIHVRSADWEPAKPTSETLVKESEIIYEDIIDGEIIEERSSEELSWEMWFGILIGASLVMLVVLCSLCVIFLVRRRVPPKEFVESSHGTFGHMWDRSIDEYENMTIVKEGNRQVITIDRRGDSSHLSNPMVNPSLRPKSCHFSSDLATQSSTLTDETQSLIDEPNFRSQNAQNQIQLTREGFVVQV